MLAPGVDPVQQKHTREVQHRLESADLVVSGKVTAVRLPAGTEHIGGTRGAGDPTPANPVSVLRLCSSSPCPTKPVATAADKSATAASTAFIVRPLPS